MKLASYVHDGNPGYGLIAGEGVIPLLPHLGSRCPDLKTLLAEGVGLAAPYADRAAELTLAQVTLLPVIPNPGAVWCAAINTHSHFDEAKERMGAKAKPDKPVLFLRAANTLVGSGDYLEKPALETRFDYEGEIALVIGRHCRNVSAAEAVAAIAGYACFNDASARDYQLTSSQVTAGKNAFRSGGFGPWLATADTVDLDGMKMICRVNGAMMQEMTLDDLIFSFGELIAFISEVNALHPGDVIVTGSPVGVGALRNPPVLLGEGDIVEVEVSGVGTLSNPVREQVVGAPL